MNKSEICIAAQNHCFGWHVWENTEGNKNKAQKFSPRCPFTNTITIASPKWNFNKVLLILNTTF